MSGWTEAAAALVLLVPKLWTRGTIELRNTVRGALLDISYRSAIAAAVKREAFVPALTAPRVLVCQTSNYGD